MTTTNDIYTRINKKLDLLIATFGEHSDKADVVQIVNRLLGDPDTATELQALRADLARHRAEDAIRNPVWVITETDTGAQDDLRG
jgi:hypothetical protein